MPSLKKLNLAENPISYMENYRANVISILP